MPLKPEELAPDLKELAESLIGQIFTYVKGAGPAKAKVAADLSRRMAIYAAQGNKVALSMVYSQAASELQIAKLEAEEKVTDMIKVAGAFLLDVAEKFLPRVLNQLFPEDE